MRWRRWLFADWKLKLAGIGIAVALWYWSSGRPVEMTVRAPVELAGSQGSLVLVRLVPDAVSVRVAARRSLVKGLVPGAVRAMVGRPRTGRRVFAVELGPDNVVCPAGVRVIDVRPALVIVEIETRVRGGD